MRQSRPAAGSRREIQGAARSEASSIIPGCRLRAAGIDRGRQDTRERLGCHRLEAIAAGEVVMNQASLGARRVLRGLQGGTLAAEPIGSLHGSPPVTNVGRSFRTG